MCTHTYIYLQRKSPLNSQCGACTNYSFEYCYSTSTLSTFNVPFHSTSSTLFLYALVSHTQKQNGMFLSCDDLLVACHLVVGSLHVLKCVPLLDFREREREREGEGQRERDRGREREAEKLNSVKPTLGHFEGPVFFICSMHVQYMAVLAHILPVTYPTTL